MIVEFLWGHVLLTVLAVLASKGFHCFMLNHCFIVGFFSKAAASRAVIMQECPLGDCFVCIHQIRI